MSRLRYKRYTYGLKRRYRIEKLTLIGWWWAENSLGVPIAFNAKVEAETFLRKYNSLKKSKG
jgi:hypothetical protein